MKIAGIIPARFNSTRFPGKALADIDGTPMVCRVCRTALSCTALDEVWVATDSPRIREVCGAYGFSVIMTGNFHKNPTSRVKEASDRIDADLYVMIGGDEPLVTETDIERVVAEALRVRERSGSAGLEPETPLPWVVNAMTGTEGRAELDDPTNIKVVCDGQNFGLYLSRLPLPFPEKDAEYPHKKFVSIGVYTKEALDFFAATPQGLLERAEECDLLRFIEHRKPVLFTDIRHHTHSVDTPADLRLVTGSLSQKGDS